MYTKNPFLSLAHQYGELQKAVPDASRSRGMAPEEVLRDARERHMLYKAFVISATPKPAPRRVGLARIQYGDGEVVASVASIADMQRHDDPTPQQERLPEMEEPVLLTRTLSRSIVRSHTKPNPNGAPQKETVYNAEGPADHEEDTLASDTSYSWSPMPPSPVTPSFQAHGVFGNTLVSFLSGSAAAAAATQPGGDGIDDTPYDAGDEGSTTHPSHLPLRVPVPSPQSPRPLSSIRRHRRSFGGGGSVTESGTAGGGSTSSTRQLGGRTPRTAQPRSGTEPHLEALGIATHPTGPTEPRPPSLTAINSAASISCGVGPPQGVLGSSMSTSQLRAPSSNTAAHQRDNSALFRLLGASAIHRTATGSSGGDQSRVVSATAPQLLLDVTAAGMLDSPTGVTSTLPAMTPPCDVMLADGTLAVQDDVDMAVMEDITAAGGTPLSSAASAGLSHPPSLHLLTARASAPPSSLQSPQQPQPPPQQSQPQHPNHHPSYRPMTAMASRNGGEASRSNSRQPPATVLSNLSLLLPSTTVTTTGGSAGPSPHYIPSSAGFFSVPATPAVPSTPCVLASAGTLDGAPSTVASPRLGRTPSDSAGSRSPSPTPQRINQRRCLAPFSRAAWSARGASSAAMGGGTAVAAATTATAGGGGTLLSARNSRTSVDVSAQQVARNAVLAGWSSRRAGTDRQTLTCGAGGSFTDQASLRPPASPLSVAGAGERLGSLRLVDGGTWNGTGSETVEMSGGSARSGSVVLNLNGGISDDECEDDGGGLIGELLLQRTLSCSAEQPGRRLPLQGAAGRLMGQSRWSGTTGSGGSGGALNGLALRTGLSGAGAGGGVTPSV